MTLFLAPAHLWQHLEMLTYQMSTLETTLEQLAPRETHHQYPLPPPQNSHAQFSAGDQHVHNAVDALHFTRLVNSPNLLITVRGTHFSTPTRVFHTFTESREDSSHILTRLLSCCCRSLPRWFWMCISMLGFRTLNLVRDWRFKNSSAGVTPVTE